MRNQHLRNYLLFSAYSILPGYLICRHTFFGFLFPYAMSTTTTIVAGFLAGGILYTSSLIYSYFSSTGFSKPTKPWVLFIIWGILLAEWFSPFVYLGPFHTLWVKAAVYDSQRTGNYAHVKQFRSRMEHVRLTHPRAYAFMFSSTQNSHKPATATAPQALNVKPVENAPAEETITKSPTPYTPPSKISGISSVGALLDGKLRKWGKQEDGSVISLNADRTSVTLLTPDGETIILALKVE
jgi:hypothetical protein